MDINPKSIPKIFAALLALFVLALICCTDSALDPVFYALEQEKTLIDDRGFPDDAVVQRIVRDSSGAGRYFAAAGALYTRTTGNWSRIAPPQSGALCTNVEIFDPGAGAQLLAAYISGSTGLGLWQRSADLSDSWSRLNVTGSIGDETVGLLKTVGSNLFVAALSGSVYNLYYSSDLLTFSLTNITGVAISDGPISDISQDGTGDYWVSVGKNLWSGTAALNDFSLFSGGPTTDGYFKGLYLTGGTLYLAALGKFYKRTAGSWDTGTSVAAIDGKSVQFTCFVEPPGLPGEIYAGTTMHGYYVTSTLTRSPSYTISELYNGAILSMLSDGTRLFIGTYGSGLWRGENIAGTWNWKRE